MVDSGMAAERRAHTTAHVNHTHSVKPDGLHDGVGGDHKHYIGAYSPDARKKRIQRFLEKRKKRVWTKKVRACPLLLPSLLDLLLYLLAYQVILFFVRLMISCHPR